jgi:hypothetical protein
MVLPDGTIRENGYNLPPYGTLVSLKSTIRARRSDNLSVIPGTHSASTIPAKKNVDDHVGK